MKIPPVFSTYGFYGMCRLAVDLAWTKVSYPQARIIRRPAYIRGPGRIQFGAGFTSGPGLRIDAIGSDALVTIGQGVQVNNNVHIGATKLVSIGNRVLIASGVFIADHNHGTYSGSVQSSPLVPPAERQLTGAAVSIDDDVWIGEHVCILPGVQIGKGVVIGAGAVVTADLPSFTIAVGAPARVIKRFDFLINAWVSVD